MSIRLTPKITL